MTSGTASLEEKGGAPQFTKADQIKQLNDIDKVCWPSLHQKQVELS